MQAIYKMKNPGQQVIRDYLLQEVEANLQVSSDKKWATRMTHLVWYPRPESNRHSRKNRILNPARLPVPPLGHFTNLTPISKDWPLAYVFW